MPDAKPIKDDTLMVLMILAFAGMNVSVASGAADNPYGHANLKRHAVRLLDDEGRLNAERCPQFPPR